MCDFDVHLNCSNVPAQPVKPANMHQYQTNFGAFPNQTPMPQAQNVQQPGFGAARSAPQVPPYQAPHYQHFHPSYPATGVPVNPGIQPPVTPLAQRQNPEIMLLLQRLQELLANSSGQNGFNQNHLQALLAGGGVGGGVGGFGGGAVGLGGGLGGFGGRTGGVGGLQDLITQAISGVGNGVGGNIPGLNFLGNGGGGGGLDLLQGLLGGGGGNGLDVLGGLLGQFL